MTEADSPQLRLTRRSYTCETKLEGVRFYHENSVYLTAKKFGLNTKRFFVGLNRKRRFLKQSTNRRGISCQRFYPQKSVCFVSKFLRGLELALCFG